MPSLRGGHSISVVLRVQCAAAHATAKKTREKVLQIWGESVSQRKAPGLRVGRCRNASGYLPEASCRGRPAAGGGGATKPTCFSRLARVDANYINCQQGMQGDKRRNGKIRSAGHKNRLFVGILRIILFFSLLGGLLRGGAP